MMGLNAYDGFFNININEDGIYVKVFSAQENGKKVSIEEIIEGLEQKNIKNYNIEGLKAELKKEYSEIEVKVAEKIVANNIEDSYKIEISDDRMEAKIIFFPIDGESVVDPKKVLYNLKQRSVTNGIDTSLIEQLVQEHEFNVPYVIAKGTPAIDGTPASIEYHFSTDKDMKPQLDEDGSVNYRKLNVIANVKKGDLLAKLIPEIEGVKGTDLYGNDIIPKKPKPIRLRYGKNVIPNDDRTELYADEDGLVKLVDNKVVVNNTYEVPNNVGNSTGDIEFEGTVIVHGNVITGFTVIAKGDIEVHGVVEGATLKASGNIILHRGIQGMNKSLVESSGNIQAKYIENANVISGGDIHSEAILHSTVSAKGVITVEGKKGMISGGTVRSGIEIKSKTLGSHMGTVTNLEVGIDPLMLEEYNNLRKDLPKLEDESKKLEQVVTLLNKRKEMSGELDEAKQEMYLSAVRNKIFLTNKLNIAKKRLEELQEEVDNKNSGSVKVSGIVYPGVKISIGNYSYFVKDEIKYVQFYKSGADIKMTSL